MSLFLLLVLHRLFPVFMAHFAMWTGCFEDELALFCIPLDNLS